MVDDPAKLAVIWSKACELAVKFLDEDKAVVLVRNAGIEDSCYAMIVSLY